MVDPLYCSKCGQRVGPAATSCDECGRPRATELDRIKVSGFSSKGLIMAILVILLGWNLLGGLTGLGLPDEWKAELNNLASEIKALIVGEDEPVERGVVARTKPARPKAAVPTTARRLDPNLTFVTKAGGYLVSLKKDDLLRAVSLQRADKKDELEKMLDNKEVGRLKEGLEVVIQEVGGQGADWVRVQMKGKPIYFYTTKNALGPGS